MRGTRENLHEEAERMGVRVVWTDLGGAVHGYYRDSERLIVLDLCLAESADGK